MRLTLRTLLAYMDDILDPADQEALGRKIESSPFATELIHRSRDAMRRLRLSAPDPLAGSDDDIHGSDQNLDANTASEYLDNTLSPEAVAEFERSCLEAGGGADMLLAEAASCHHVLTMVLGEPAEVDADLRERMYALAESPAAAQQLRVEPAHKTPQQAAAAAASPAAPRAAAVDPDEAAIPDYLLAAARERRRSRRTVAAAVLAMIVGGGAMFLFWPQGEVPLPPELAEKGDVDALTQGVAIGAGTPTDATAPSAEGEAPATEAPAFEPSEASPAAPAAGAAAPPSEEAEPADAASEAPASAAAPSAETSEAAAAIAADDGPAMTPPAAPTPSEIAASEATSEPGETDAAPPAAEMPIIDAPATDAPATDAPPLNVEPPTLSLPPADEPEMTARAGETATTPSAASPEAASPETTTPDASTPEASATAPKQIGAYLGNNDVLLRYDDAAGGWVRVPARTALVGGEKLLALPTFRTHVVLADVNAYLSGGAEIDLLPAAELTAPAEFGFRFPYGRIILNSGLNGNRVELALAGSSRLVELGPSSSLAIEVVRLFEPGSGSNRQPAPAIIRWYLTSGSAKWDGQSAEAPARWTTAEGEDSDPLPIDELPEWVDRAPISDIERRARDVVAEALVPGEPVKLRILELSDKSGAGRRVEVRSLAARSGAYVGLYDALVRSLGDVDQRSAWKSQIEELRQAIARDPAAAEGIRAAFAIERGQEAANDLMEMLLGFDSAAVGTTREEVQEGALVRLIRWMDDEDLVYRNLASYNVNEITGTSNLGGYRPEHTAEQRKRELRHYWQRLENGELMPREQP